MKLYKLFEEAILEAEIIHKLLTENVSREAVIDAINNKYNVNIEYDDYPGAEPPVPPSKRYIQVYNFASTKADNDAIRAFQIFGGTKTENSAWKIFRLDRIRSWTPTKVKFATPISNKGANIPKYNDQGDRSMKQIYNKVDFNQNKEKI